MKSVFRQFIEPRHTDAHPFRVDTQAILLPTDLATVGGGCANSGGGRGGAQEQGRTAEEEENLTCLAMGTITSAEGEGAARFTFVPQMAKPPPNL